MKENEIGFGHEFELYNLSLYKVGTKIKQAARTRLGN